MWIKKEHVENEHIVYVIVEVEPHEDVLFVNEYLKKHYPNSEIRLVTPSDSGHTYNKIENIYPHVNVINVVGKKDTGIRKNYLRTI